MTPQTVADLYPSKWLKAEDLAGRSVTLTITAVAVEQLHNPRTHKPEPKAILDFGRSELCLAQPRLPLNPTQCHALAALAGSDRFADWPGLRITLSPATAPNGKPTIRITAAPAPANGAPPGEPATPPAADPLPTAEWEDIQPAKPAPST